MTLACYLLGLVALAVAAFLISIPLGVAVAGLALGAAGWLLEEVAE